MGFLSSTVVKNLPANAEDMGGEEPLEEEMASHSSILAWENPMDRRAWQATVHRVSESWYVPSIPAFWRVFIINGC